jgi:hypothetical protein
LSFRWGTKTFEVVGVDVSNIIDSRKTSSQKQCNSFSLMEHVLDACDYDTYEHENGKLEWENVMSNEYNSLMKNKTWDFILRPHGKDVVKH